MTGVQPPAASTRAAPTFDVHLVPIGDYATDLPDPFDAIPADDEAQAIADLLAPFGGIVDPSYTTAAPRDSAWVKTQLGAWSARGEAGSSVLVWVGHGESDGDEAWLASFETAQGKKSSGHGPGELANHVDDEWSTRRGDDGTWTIVVVEACGAERFVELLASEVLRKANPAKCVAFVPAGGTGTSYLGAVPRALSAALGSYTDNDETIRVDDLVARLDERLTPGSTITCGLSNARPLTRPRDLLQGITAPQSVYLELKAFVAGLPDDQRGHFVPKAQGAEQGEPAWYFVGRADEHRAVAGWLNSHDRGLLVVTGPAGSGKSALLGNILVHTTPGLRDLLIQAREVEPLPRDQQPADNVFDAAVSLTGLSTADLVARLVAGAGLEPQGTDLGISERVDRLLAALKSRTEPFTVLADALDEARDPLAVAGAVIRRVAAIPGCRVVIGTRSSTDEGPDIPTTRSTNLLDALGGAGRFTTVTVGLDTDAVTTYVQRRLDAARPTWVNNLGADDAVSTVARSIGAKNRQFLYARLAVHEILTRPELLTADNRDELTALLARDHRALFATAVERLTSTDPVFDPLLEALAFARGRGLPRADHIWATVASALADDRRVSEMELDNVLDKAAPYIMLDAEDGQSVYRLAHRTFQEYFLARHRTSVPAAEPDPTSRTTHVASALLALCRGRVGSLNPYLRRHVSGHVAVAGIWHRLAATPDVLDGLDASSLVCDVLNTASKWQDLPVEVAGTIANRHLIEAEPADFRPSLRVLGEARTAGYARARETPARPSHTHVTWARRFVRDSVSVPLTGHTNMVMAVAVIPMPDGQVLLATGSSDRTVRLWDPVTGTQVGDPLTGHTSPVTAVAVVPMPDGRVMLATGSWDTTVRLWDPVTETQVGDPMTGHTSMVTTLTVIRRPDGQVLLATGSSDETVRLWDLPTGAPIGEPLTGHTGEVYAVVVVPMPDGRIMLATGSRDETVRLWDPVTGTQVGDPLTGHTGIVDAVTAVPMPDGRILLATGSRDGTVRLWDPATGVQVGDPMVSHTGPVTAVTVIPLPDGQVLLATGNSDDTVRLWDPANGAPVGDPLRGHTGMVTAMAAVPMLDSRVLLATGSWDTTARLWDPLAHPQVGAPRAGRISMVMAMVMVPMPDGQVLLATGNSDATVQLWDPATGFQVGDPLNGRTSMVTTMTPVHPFDSEVMLVTGLADATVQLWDLLTGTPVGDPMTGHTGPVTAVAPLPLPDGRVLFATCSWDETVRLWDPLTRTQVGKPLTGHTSMVMAITTVPMPDGRTLLATGGSDRTVRLWDPVTGTQVGGPLTGHTGPVMTVTTVPMPDGRTLLATGGWDTTVRLWDPVTGTQVGNPLDGHTGTVMTAASVPLCDGRALLATGGADRTLRLWDPVASTPVHRRTLDDEVADLSVDKGRIFASTGRGLIAIHLPC